MSTTSAGQPAVTQTERVPLSLNQEFVCLFDSGGEDGPFGPHYHIVEAWRVRGPVDVAAMQRALRDVENPARFVESIKSQSARVYCVNGFEM